MNETTISIKPPICTDNVCLTSPNTPPVKVYTMRAITTQKKLTKIYPMSKAGYSSSGNEKINQDNYFITQNFLHNPDDYLLGVW